MNAFQSRVLAAIAAHPGINRNEIALALEVPHINNSYGRHLRYLEGRGRVMSMFVNEGGRRRVKVYRVR